MRAEDIMTADPLYAEETASLAEAMALLAEREIRHLPIVRDGELVGIVSDRDFRGLGLSVVNDVESYDALRQRMQRSVSELVNTTVVSVETETELEEIIDVFVEEKVGAVPVVEPGTMHMVGIISVIDILRAVRDHVGGSDD